MQAILRMNEQRTAFQVSVDGQEFETAAWPESQLQLMNSPKGGVFAAVLDGMEGLKPFTVYQLVPIETTCVNEDLDDADEDDEDDADFDEEDDDEEDDDEEEEK